MRQTLPTSDSIISCAKGRNDSWGNEVLLHAQTESDLVSAEAKYHHGCALRFRSSRQTNEQSEKRRPPHFSRVETFEKLYQYLKNNVGNFGKIAIAIQPYKKPTKLGLNAVSVQSVDEIDVNLPSIKLTLSLDHLLWTPAQRSLSEVHVIFCECFFHVFYGHLMLRPRLTEVRETFTHGGP